MAADADRPRTADAFERARPRDRRNAAAPLPPPPGPPTPHAPPAPARRGAARGNPAFAAAAADRLRDNAGGVLAERVDRAGAVALDLGRTARAGCAAIAAAATEIE